MSIDNLKVIIKNKIKDILKVKVKASIRSDDDALT